MSATKAAITQTEIQNTPISAKIHSQKRMSLMKSYALLPIICIAIFVQISTVSARTLHGRKQILHTLENRMNHHRNLLRYERDLAPKYTEKQLHRHLNKNSINMTCSGELIKYLTSVQSQANISLNTLREGVAEFTLARFGEQPEESYNAWNIHSLNLSHPYTHFYRRHYSSNADSHIFDHLVGKKLNQSFFKEELIKIYTTWKILEGVYEKIVDENNKKNWADRDQQSYNGMMHYLNLTFRELQTNRRVASNILGFDMLKDLDKHVTLNYNTTAQVREWLIILESISFLDYLNKLCTALMEICA